MILQLYAVADNLLDWTQMDYAKNINVQFGMNLLFGYKSKRKLSKLDSDNNGTNLLRQSHPMFKAP